MKRSLATAAAIGMTALISASASPGCFGPVGVVGEWQGNVLPKLRHAIYTDVLFGAGESLVWVVVSDDANLCNVIEERFNAGMPCFDGWGDVERLHLRLPGRPEPGDYVVTGGACFSEFGTTPSTAVCFEGDTGLGLNGMGGAAASGGTVDVRKWVELDHVEGALDVTFGESGSDGYALGTFVGRNCGALNLCCGEVGCF